MENRPQLVVDEVVAGRRGRRGRRVRLQEGRSRAQLRRAGQRRHVGRGGSRSSVGDSPDEREALVARAGLGRLRFHDLRHAAATVMLAQGVELRVISEMLGHCSLGMTADVYAAVVPALGRAAARMDEALGSRR